MKKAVTGFVFLLSLVVISSSPAMAASISYSLTDLGSQQQDLWQIDYQLTGFDSDTYDGLQIFFNYGEYEDIALLSSSSDWDVLIFQPDMVFGLEEDGTLDALPLTAGGVLSGSFSVQALWLGTGLPGTQSFELYNSTDWTAQESGTTSPVPVPGALFLMFSGLAALAAGRRKFNK